MPCSDGRPSDDLTRLYGAQDRCDAATKAACEMAKLIKTKDKLHLLSASTRRWIKEHEAFDKTQGR